jgi:hypothetical protein
MTDLDRAADYFKHHNTGLSEHVRVIGYKFCMNDYDSPPLPDIIAEAIAKEYLWKILKEKCEITSRIFSPENNNSVQFNASMEDGENELSLLLDAVENLDKKVENVEKEKIKIESCPSCEWQHTVMSPEETGTWCGSCGMYFKYEEPYEDIEDA